MNKKVESGEKELKKWKVGAKFASTFHFSPKKIPISLFLLDFFVSQFLDTSIIKKYQFYYIFFCEPIY